MICTRSAAKTEDRDKRRHGLATYDSKHYIVHCYIQDEAGSNPTGQSAAGGRMTATVHKTRRTSIIEKKVEKVEGVAILNSKGFSIGLGLMKNLKSFFLHKDKRISSCPRPPAPRTDSTQKLHPLETTPLQASFVVDDHQQRTSEACIHSAARIYCRLPGPALASACSSSSRASTRTSARPPKPQLHLKTTPFGQLSRIEPNHQPVHWSSFAALSAAAGNRSTVSGLSPPRPLLAPRLCSASSPPKLSSCKPPHTNRNCRSKVYSKTATLSSTQIFV